MGVNQSIISKNNLNTQLQAITLLSQSLTNSSKISEQDLKKAITAQYITAYGDLEQLRFNRQVIDLLTKEEGILKKLTRGNTYRQSDYLTFLVTLKQQELQLSQSRALYKNDYATLSYRRPVWRIPVLWNWIRPLLSSPYSQSPVKASIFSSIGWIA